MPTWRQKLGRRWPATAPPQVKLHAVPSTASAGPGLAAGNFLSMCSGMLQEKVDSDGGSAARMRAARSSSAARVRAARSPSAARSSSAVRVSSATCLPSAAAAAAAAADAAVVAMASTPT